MQPIRAVLFDFGHTLVDFHRTEEALHAAYEQIRGRIEAAAYLEVPELLDLVERIARGIDRLVEESYRERRLEEFDLATGFREALAGIGFDLPDDVLDHVIALDHSAYSNSMAVEPDVLAVLEELRRRGLRLGIVSNISLLPHLLRQDLDRLGIGPRVDASVFSSETGLRKPDRRIFEEALRRVGARPVEAVFVGDRLYDDVGGAKALGMRAVQTVQFRKEERKEPGPEPDATISHLSELPALIEAWEGPSRDPPPRREPA